MEKNKPKKQDDAPNTARPPGDWQVPNPDEYPDPNTPDTTSTPGEVQS